MKILSIETSCDETALAILDASGNEKGFKFKVNNTALYSQIEKHKEYGGVFPSLAKREHALNLIPLLTEITVVNGNGVEISEETKKELTEMLDREPDLLKAFLEYIPKISKPDIDMIAVTTGPGLEPALWVGINFARALSLVWQTPIMPVNHMEGHIASVMVEAEEISPEIQDIAFPAIALLISGGHTQLVKIDSWGKYEIIGSTRDDAVGEAFDKTARLLGLPYPGGPEISKLAQEARNMGLVPSIEFPRPMINSGDLNFSFSGLKTSVLYTVKKIGELDENMKKEIALEFENAATDVLVTKTKKAIEDSNAQTLIVGGGVIANRFIRENLTTMTDSLGIQILLPSRDLSTDNAIMIGIAGFIKSFREKPAMGANLKAIGNLSL